MVPIVKKPAPGDHKSSLKISLAKLFLARCPYAWISNLPYFLHFFSLSKLMINTFFYRFFRHLNFCYNLKTWFKISYFTSTSILFLEKNIVSVKYWMLSLKITDKIILALNIDKSTFPFTNFKYLHIPTQILTLEHFSFCYKKNIF